MRANVVPAGAFLATFLPVLLLNSLAGCKPEVIQAKSKAPAAAAPAETPARRGPIPSQSGGPISAKSSAPAVVLPAPAKAPSPRSLQRAAPVEEKLLSVAEGLKVLTESFKELERELLARTDGGSR